MAGLTEKYLTMSDTGDNSTGMVADSNRTSTGNVLCEWTTSWNGTVVAGIEAQAGDDTINKDEAEISIKLADAASYVEVMRIRQNGNLEMKTGKVQQNAAPTVGDDLVNLTYLLGAGFGLYKGVIDASTNPNYPAGVVGDRYHFSVAGKIGGASGEQVEAGDALVCNEVNAGGDEATVGTKWNVFQTNWEFSTQAEAEGRTNNSTAMTPLRVEQLNEATLPRVGTPDWTKLEHLFTILGSAGHIEGGEITSSGGGTTFDVAAGQGMIRTTDEHHGELRWIEWIVSTGNAIADPAVDEPNSVKYPGVEYNGGAPQVVIKSTDVWNYHDEWPLGHIAREGVEAHIGNYPQSIPNTLSHLIERHFEVIRFERTSGLIIGETGTRNLTMSLGIVWTKIRLDFTAIDTSASDTCHTYIDNGSGGWTKDHGALSSTRWDNTLYDDLTGTPGTMSSSKFLNIFFYLETDDGDLVRIIGRTQHSSLADAEAEGSPAVVPKQLQVNGIYLGRLIFQKSDATAQLIKTAFEEGEGAALTVTSHDDLNLKSGTGPEFNHINDPEQTALLAMIAGTPQMGGLGHTKKGVQTGDTETTANDRWVKIATITVDTIGQDITMWGTVVTAKNTVSPAVTEYEFFLQINENTNLTTKPGSYFSAKVVNSFSATAHESLVCIIPTPTASVTIIELWAFCPYQYSAVSYDIKHTGWHSGQEISPAFLTNTAMMATETATDKSIDADAIDNKAGIPFSNSSQTVIVSGTRIGGVALATTATEGFLFLPTTNGPPTGVPVAVGGSTHGAAIYDSANNLLYIYDGTTWNAK